MTWCAVREIGRIQSRIAVEESDWPQRKSAAVNRHHAPVLWTRKCTTPYVCHTTMSAPSMGRLRHAKQKTGAASGVDRQFLRLGNARWDRSVYPKAVGSQTRRGSDGGVVISVQRGLNLRPQLVAYRWPSRLVLDRIAYPPCTARFDVAPIGLVGQACTCARERIAIDIFWSCGHSDDVSSSAALSSPSIIISIRAQNRTPGHTGHPSLAPPRTPRVNPHV